MSAYEDMCLTSIATVPMDFRNDYHTTYFERSHISRAIPLEPESTVACDLMRILASRGVHGSADRLHRSTLKQNLRLLFILHQSMHGFGSNRRAGNTIGDSFGIVPEYSTWALSSSPVSVAHRDPCASWRYRSIRKSWRT